MQEIKFRAWDKFREKMFYPDGLVFDKETGINIIDLNDYTQGEFPQITGWRGGGLYELMQYTGLKDKNGKEIYEGDIVKMKAEIYGDNGKLYFEYIGIVKIWSSKGCVIKVIIQDGEKLWHSRNFYKNVVGYRSEVIGNIYENSELLKEDNAGD